MKLMTALVRNVPTSRLMLCSVLLLAACGQKGPLYFPDETAPPSEPFSECDAPKAPCRQPLPESSTAPGATSTESTAP